MFFSAIALAFSSMRSHTIHMDSAQHVWSPCAIFRYLKVEMDGHHQDCHHRRCHFYANMAFEIIQNPCVYHACMLPQICCHRLQFHSVCTLWLPGHQRLLFSASVCFRYIYPFKLPTRRHRTIPITSYHSFTTFGGIVCQYGNLAFNATKQKRRIVATKVKYTFGPFFASNYQTNFLLAFFVGAKCTTNLILTSKYFALLETKTPVRLPIPV